MPPPPQYLRFYLVKYIKVYNAIYFGTSYLQWQSLQIVCTMKWQSLQIVCTVKWQSLQITCTVKWPLDFFETFSGVKVGVVLVAEVGWGKHISIYFSRFWTTSFHLLLSLKCRALMDFLGLIGIFESIIFVKPNTNPNVSGQFELYHGRDVCLRGGGRSWSNVSLCLQRTSPCTRVNLSPLLTRKRLDLHILIFGESGAVWTFKCVL